MNNDVISQVRYDQLPLECILTPKQLLYYREYFREGKTLSEISIMYGVSVSNICHVLKLARRRIIEYYGEHTQNIYCGNCKHCQKAPNNIFVCNEHNHIIDYCLRDGSCADWESITRYDEGV